MMKILLAAAVTAGVLALAAVPALTQEHSGQGPVPRMPAMGADPGPTIRTQAEPMPGMTGAPMEHPAGSQPFYRERTFLVVVGVGIAGAGFVAYRLSRRRWRRGPAAFVSEAVLVVDLVESTRLATHYGDGLAMRARNALKERALAIAEGHGLAFAENTGDGCLMTFPSAVGAVETAMALLKELRDRPPDVSPGPPLAVRAGISYGEILLDVQGARHGAAINKAFRLEGLSRESLAPVEGKSELSDIPERNRIFLDEEAARELVWGDLGAAGRPVMESMYAYLALGSALFGAWLILFAAVRSRAGAGRRGP